jgi:hypothetical protein
MAGNTRITKAELTALSNRMFGGAPPNLISHTAFCVEWQGFSAAGELSPLVLGSPA